MKALRVSAASASSRARSSPSNSARQKQASIQTPVGWFAFVVPTPPAWSYDPGLDPDSGTYGIDPVHFIDPPFIVRFFTDDPFTYGVTPFTTPFLDGFSFLSDYAAANGPAVVSSSGPIIIDPSIPLGPGHPSFAPPAPTPAALPVGLIGLGALAIRRRRVRI